MLALAAFASAMFASPIEEFCPMVAGTKWTYTDERGVEIVDEIGAEINAGGGTMAFTKTETIGGKGDGSELLRIEGDTLELVGYLSGTASKKEIKLMTPPQPIVRIGATKLQWDFNAEVATTMGPVLQRIHGESFRGPKRKVLGKEVETVMANLTSRIGNDKTSIEVRQNMVYGKGVGLVEMSSATKAQGQTVKRMLKLTKLELPEQNP